MKETKCEEGFFGTKHNWDKWTIVSEGNITRNDSKSVIGRFLNQKRTCKDCGFSEINLQENY